MNTQHAKHVQTLAASMSFSRCAEILTWVDEPELLAEPGEQPPSFSATEIAAARLAGDRYAREHRAAPAWAAMKSRIH